MPNIEKAKAHKTRSIWLLTVLCALMLASLSAVAANAPQVGRPSMLAQIEPTATTTADPAAIATPSLADETPLVPIEATEVTTATATPEGTPTPRPTPSGPPPADPYAELTVFGFLTAGNLVAKRDRMPLDGGSVEEVLLTITEARLGIMRPITEEVTSAIGVAKWDPVYYSWSLAWQSQPISGTARLLPAANTLGGWNGGQLLGTSDRVMALRTTLLDGTANLQLFKWNKDTDQGEPLRMIPANGGPEQDALFSGDLDVNVADLDDDRKFEVIVDNVAGVQIWRWDGAKYVPVEAR